MVMKAFDGQGFLALSWLNIHYISNNKIKRTD